MPIRRGTGGMVGLFAARGTIYNQEVQWKTASAEENNLQLPRTVHSLHKQLIRIAELDSSSLPRIDGVMSCK